MRVGPDEARAMARLAGLELGDADADRIAAELRRVLEHVAELSGVDTSSVPAFETAVEGVAPLRTDEPDAPLLDASAVTGAPEMKDGFFTVPRLLGRADADSGT